MDLENNRKTGLNDLIQMYLSLKDKYRNYDTRSALRFMQAFRKSIVDMREMGLEIGLEVLGSLNFGLADKNSDADIIIIHYCELHGDTGECLPDCPNLNTKKELLSLTMAKKMRVEKFYIEILDCINMSYIDQLLTRGYSDDDAQVLRFIFYFVTGRPVNRTFFSKQYKVFIENIQLVNNFNTWASEALSTYLRTSDHRYSFQKYNERIKGYGLQLPLGLRQELEKYLL